MSTVSVCLSVGLSVCPVNRQQQRRAAGLPQPGRRRQISIGRPYGYQKWPERRCLESNRWSAKPYSHAEASNIEVSYQRSTALECIVLFSWGHERDKQTNSRVDYCPQCITVNATDWSPCLANREFKPHANPNPDLTCDLTLMSPGDDPYTQKYQGQRSVSISNRAVTKRTDAHDRSHYLLR